MKNSTILLANDSRVNLIYVKKEKDVDFNAFKPERHTIEPGFWLIRNNLSRLFTRNLPFMVVIKKLDEAVDADMDVFSDSIQSNHGIYLWKDEVKFKDEAEILINHLIDIIEYTSYSGEITFKKCKYSDHISGYVIAKIRKFVMDNDIPIVVREEV